MQQPGLPKISRRAATLLIPSIIAAAHRANVMTLTLHRITRIAVFGSYVSTRKSMLGDLDIAVKTEHIIGRDFDAFMEAHPFPSEMQTEDRLYWPFWNVAIKTFVTFHVHITEWDIIDRLAPPHRVIFRADPDGLRPPSKV